MRSYLFGAVPAIFHYHKPFYGPGKFANREICLILAFILPVLVNSEHTIGVRDRRIITYSSRLVLLHANCVKKPHRSSTMVRFFAWLAHKITSSILSNLFLCNPLVGIILKIPVL